MLKGIDFAAGNGVTVWQIQHFGAAFVARYLTGLDGNSKDITAPELANYINAHPQEPVVFVFEVAGQMFTEAQGIADAKAAVAQLASIQTELETLGLLEPSLQTATIFFAQDLPESPGIAPLSYLKGVNSVIGKARTGLYARYGWIKAAFDAGRITYGWQTSGGSDINGKLTWDDRALIRQEQYDVKVGPCSADIDYAAYWNQTKVLTVKDDYGQWPRPTDPKPKPASGPVRHVANGDISLRRASQGAKTSVLDLVKTTVANGSQDEIAAMAEYLASANWTSWAPLVGCGYSANAKMPKGLVYYTAK